MIGIIGIFMVFSGIGIFAYGAFTIHPNVLGFGLSTIILVGLGITIVLIDMAKSTQTTKEITVK